MPVNRYMTYASLEVGDLLICQGVCLGDDGNEVHSGVQLPHELDIDRFQAKESVREKQPIAPERLTSDLSAG